MSASTKRGLGRGLGALIPQNTPIPQTPMPFMTGRSVVQLDINKIVPNPRQPRKYFDDEKLQELSSSIKEQGVNSPLLVRKRGNSFELIAGERRLRAAKKAALATIPVIIKDYSDEQSLEIAIVENLQREDLNAVEESLAYKSLSEEFKLTHEQIAKKVGKSRVAVTNSIRILELPQKIVDSISSGKISSGHARPLLTLSDHDRQIEVWQEIIKNDLSVRDVEALLSIISTETKKTKPKKHRTRSGNPVLKDIEDKLASALGTKVEIFGSPQKGKININYYSQEDLERILEEIIIKHER
ncbi:MAG: ParB/RepB/Spo0J family partition protein [Candidatus Margulisiibacteriota bacterium]